MMGNPSAWTQQPIAEKPAPSLSRFAAHDSVDEITLQKRASSAPRLDAVLSARSKPVGEARPNLESSLLSSSIILFDGEKFTLVPVGSILHLPEAQRLRVITKPEGEFTFWPAFLKRNASWLCAREVPLKMAKGDARTADEVLREASTGSRVVVAVYRGGPITILEPEPSRAKHPNNH